MNNKKLSLFPRCILFFSMVILAAGIPVTFVENGAARNNDDVFYFNGFRASESLSADEIRTRIHAILSVYQPEKKYAGLRIVHPFNNAVFPRNMASPLFLWEDSHTNADVWLVIIKLHKAPYSIYILTDQREWLPGKDAWRFFQHHAGTQPAHVTIVGSRLQNSDVILSRAGITVSVSKDAVNAPILFHQISPPFAHAVFNQDQFEWRLGDVASYDHPQTLAESKPTCQTCHFRGDFHNWRKSRSPVAFPRVSPDGQFILKTVNEKAFLVIFPEIDYSESFFHLKGHLAFCSAREGTFRLLPGADHPDFVHTGATWSPDGKTIVFSRAKVDQSLIDLMGDKTALAAEHRVSKTDFNAAYRFQYDLYQIPFNGGKGGTPEPVKGASKNGSSNYFPRFSPDNKWIVFTRTQTGFLLEPESQLYIIPAKGGTPRKMKCNLKRHNSWHSFSPNGRWLIFTSRFRSPYTKLFLTHVDENGNDSPPVLLSRFSTEKKAIIAPEFTASAYGKSASPPKYPGENAISKKKEGYQ
jgi:hypothetical protein